MQDLITPEAGGGASLSEVIGTFRASWETSMAEDLHSVGPSRNQVKPWAAPMETLKAWKKPAGSMADALEALRLARDEAKDYDESPLVFSMVSAALGFLEKPPAGERADHYAAYSSVREGLGLVRLMQQALENFLNEHPVGTEKGEMLRDIEQAGVAAARCLDRGIDEIDQLGVALYGRNFVMEADAHG